MSFIPISEAVKPIMGRITRIYTIREAIRCACNDTAIRQIILFNHDAGLISDDDRDMLLADYGVQL